MQRIIGTDVFSAEIYFLTQIPARIEPREVASVLAFRDASLGIIPSGSGNGLARELAIPFELKDIPLP